MIGFYDYTVILTYMSLASSIIGMFFLLNNHPILAILCLSISGLLDMFDGKVARTKKNRTDDEKMFGVQIDSLVDVICFGFYPAILCYTMGHRGIIAILILVFYALAAVIRLAFFNVIEINRQMKEDGANKFYHGLPVTSIAVILPLTFLFKLIMPLNIFYWVLLGVMLITGIAFIVDFKLRKPNNKELVIIVIIVAIAMIRILLRTYYEM